MSPQDRISASEHNMFAGVGCASCTALAARRGGSHAPSITPRKSSGTGSSLNTEAVPSCSRTISPRTEAMSPPLGQSLPQMGDGWYLLSLSLPQHPPRFRRPLGALYPLTARTCAPWTPPSRPARSGLEAGPDATWPTPLSLAKAPGAEVGQEAHLPLGLPFLLWVKEHLPFG